MNDFDLMATQLFEEAKRFLEKATSHPPGDAQDAFTHAALLLAFSSLEAHVNAVAEELLIRPNLGILDKSILGETEFSLDDNGNFKLSNKLKMYRLEDRLLYIFSNFSIAPAIAPKSKSWWGELKNASTTRNKLVHPKSGVSLSTAEVTKALTAILECLNDIYHSVFGRPFPTFNKGLHSKFHF